MVFSVIIFLFIIFETLKLNIPYRTKAYILVFCFLLFIVQDIFNYIYIGVYKTFGIKLLARNLIEIILLYIPFIIKDITVTNKYKGTFLPSIEAPGVISFYEIKNKLSELNKIKGIKDVVIDLTRHNNFKYINQKSLTENYFKDVNKTLKDPYVYIVLSNTGSPASELISLFTKRQYNHTSLSFDEDLKTVISYNGGEKLFPPGLNLEQLKQFNKKTDASMIVYKMKIGKTKKEKLITLIKKINKEGSAYNILGLMFDYKHKPNIMFCSEFVNKMLEVIGENYFKKEKGPINPTDFIELDYYRKLEYCYEIKFNE